MAFGVNGSGDAKISASRMAFNSAVAFPPCGSSPMLILRIADRVRRVDRPGALVDANRAEAAGLKHPHELQPNHLEQRQKGDDQAAAIVDVAEQVVEAARLGFGQAREQLLDADLDRNLLRRQEDFRSQLRALDHRLKGGEEAEEIDLD